MSRAAEWAEFLRQQEKMRDDADNEVKHLTGSRRPRYPAGANPIASVHAGSTGEAYVSLACREIPLAQAEELGVWLIRTCSDRYECVDLEGEALPPKVVEKILAMGWTRVNDRRGE